MRGQSLQQRSVKPSITAVTGNMLQRECACGQHTAKSGSECEECKKKRQGTLQRASVNRAPTHEVPPIVYEVLRSPGQELSADTRAIMEPRFGHDFSTVRVHTGPKAAESARAVNALAYTMGSDVVFSEGQYAPKSTRGAWLLGHELTHVVQQSTSRSLLNKATIAPEHDTSEMEANRVADQVTAGFLPNSITPLARLTLQRQQADEEAPLSVTQIPAGPPMSRQEEVAHSRTSPGEITVVASPLVISLSNFAINGSDIKSEHQRALTELSSLIRRAGPGNSRIVLLGHADDSGSDELNYALSRRRAVAVRRVLAGGGLRNMRTAGLGENVPVANNSSLEGRSRNRRVDIHIVPTQPAPRQQTPPGGTQQPPVQQPPTRPTTPDEPQTRPREDDSWFCSEYPILCAAFVVGAGGAIAIWHCLQNPLSCLPIPVPSGGAPGGEPGGGESDTEQPPRRHPCPLVVHLPSGTLSAQGLPVMGQYWLKREFNMHLTFAHDPATGCDCSLGEYYQEVRGFSERTNPGSAPQRGRVRLVEDFMDPIDFQEDARENNPRLPYGHRDVPELEGDEFLPDRETGCHYAGYDGPGMTGITPGQRMRFHFEFRGAPVDRLNRRALLRSWQYWTVEGDYTIPQPPAPPTRTTSTPPPSRPTVDPQAQRPLPNQGPTIGPALTPTAPSLFCLGGSIGCETLEFLRERQRQHVVLSQDDVNEAEDIEHRLLMRTRMEPPVTDVLHHGEVYRAWVLDLRVEAHNRIYNFARSHFMPYPD